LVSDNEGIQQILMREVERDGELEGIESPQASFEAVLPDEAPGCSEVIIRQPVNFDVARRNVDHESGTLNPGRIPIERAAAHFHRERRLDFKESKAGDSHRSIALREDGGYSGRVPPSAW
jgi:hypothetical protein